ncbi:hypothetical protein BS78_04G295500 [Paspalum vaginatum]|nr:hypothetical protein BS78_04G295500 [Paspalum vaginatum]
MTGRQGDDAQSALKGDGNKKVSGFPGNRSVCATLNIRPALRSGFVQCDDYAQTPFCLCGDGSVSGFSVLVFRLTLIQCAVWNVQLGRGLSGYDVRPRRRCKI